MVRVRLALILADAGLGEPAALGWETHTTICGLSPVLPVAGCVARCASERFLVMGCAAHLLGCSRSSGWGPVFSDDGPGRACVTSDWEPVMSDQGHDLCVKVSMEAQL